MVQLVTLDLDLEREAVAKMYADWIAEHDKLVALKAECSAARHSPPNDYWQAEHRARMKYESARRFVAVLETCV